MTRHKRTRDDEIVRQLQVTNTLLAGLLSARIGQNEIIRILKHTDLTGVEIAALLGTSTGTVHVTHARWRKKENNRGKETASKNDLCHTRSVVERPNGIVSDGVRDDGSSGERAEGGDLRTEGDQDDAGLENPEIDTHVVARPSTEEA